MGHVGFVFLSDYVAPIIANTPYYRLGIGLGAGTGQEGTFLAFQGKDFKQSVCECSVDQVFFLFLSHIYV